MFIELHMIQNFAPSNLNRDDTGSPKDCEFGGVRRARISSQCLKRAMREAPIFKATTGVEPAERTKLLLQSLLKQMFGDNTTNADPAIVAQKEQSMLLLTQFIKDLYGNFKDANQTEVLIFVSQSEQTDIIAKVQEIMGASSDAKQRLTQVTPLAKEYAKKLRERTSAPDIALFGRMLATHPENNIDAACQVAHALSTHRVSMEMDFYTAMDELKKELQPGGKDEKGGAGAGMMGFSGYNSACFYRYARLDWGQLQKNLGGDVSLTRKTVAAFLRAAHDAIPSGKQNSHAAHNPPSLILAVVRNGGMGWSLANAFETPVRVRESGYIAPSAQKLDEYWGKLNAISGNETVARAAAFGLDVDLSSLNHLKNYHICSMGEWVQTVLATLPGATNSQEAA